MKLSQFRFDFPLNLIAQTPTKRREDARLMVVHKDTGLIENKNFKDVLDYFEEKDVFVVNNTKVFPARMYGRKEKTGAKIEVFLLRELNKQNRLWDVIVDPARKIRVGNKLYFLFNCNCRFWHSTPQNQPLNYVLPNPLLRCEYNPSLPD